MGASTQKRARQALRPEDLVYEDWRSENLASGSDHLKLQMMALVSHAQEGK